MKPGSGHRSWTESHVMQSLTHICNTAANNTEDYVKGKKKKKLAKIPTSQTGRQEGQGHLGLCWIQAAASHFTGISLD